MPISLWHLEQVMTHQSYSGHISLLCMACPLTGTTDLYPLAECYSVHLFSQQYSSTVTNVAIQKKWNMMNEESPILFQSTDLQRPLSSTGMRKKGAGVWDRLVIFLFWLHCRYRMLYCCKMTVYLILTASLSLFFSFSVSCCLFWPHKGSLAAAGWKAGAWLEKSGAEQRQSVRSHGWDVWERERRGEGGRGRESGVPLLLLSADIFTNMSWREEGAGSREWGGRSMRGWVKRRMKKYGRNL